MREGIVIAIMLVAIILVAGWAGGSDFEEAQREEAHYCEMVKAGKWPAYRDNTECEETK